MGSRGMEMNDVVVVRLNEPSQLKTCRYIKIIADPKWENRQSLVLKPDIQKTVWSRGDNGMMSNSMQISCQSCDLHFAASPSFLRVDVENLEATAVMVVLSCVPRAWHI